MELEQHTAQPVEEGFAGEQQDLAREWDRADQPETDFGAQQPEREWDADGDSREEQGAPDAGTGEEESPGETFRLKYMDEIHQVDREQVTALAQKGMDYDRVRAERDELRLLRDETIRTGSPEQVRRLQQQARSRDMEEFLELYPQVAPESIPKEVWAQVRQGRSLVAAYSVHEARQARQELDSLRQQEKNRARSTGSAAVNHARAQGELISRWWDEV